MKKRAYYFITDSIIALFILSVGIIYVLSFSVSEVSTKQSQVFSFDLMQFLSTTRVEEISDSYSGFGGELMIDGNITNPKNTLFKQVGEFYYRSEEKDCNYCLDIAEQFLANILKDLINDQFSYEILIDGELVYENRGDFTTDFNPKFLIPKRRIITGIYNNSELYGPYIGEVMLWQ